MPLANRVFAEAKSVPEAKATQELWRGELSRRGYSEEDLELLRRQDYSPIQCRQTD